MFTDARKLAVNSTLQAGHLHRRGGDCCHTHRSLAASLAYAGLVTAVDAEPIRFPGAVALPTPFQLRLARDSRLLMWRFKASTAASPSLQAIHRGSI